MQQEATGLAFGAAVRGAHAHGRTHARGTTRRVQPRRSSAPRRGRKVTENFVESAARVLQGAPTSDGAQMPSPLHLAKMVMTAIVSNPQLKGRLGLLLYSGFLCIWTTLALPTTPLEMFAGFSFSVAGSTIAGLIGKTCGSVLAFVIGRQLLGPCKRMVRWVRGLPPPVEEEESRPSGFGAKLEEALRKRPLQTIGMIRVAPIPGRPAPPVHAQKQRPPRSRNKHSTMVPPQLTVVIRPPHALRRREELRAVALPIFRRAAPHVHGRHTRHERTILPRVVACRQLGKQPPGGDERRRRECEKAEAAADAADSGVHDAGHHGGPLKVRPASLPPRAPWLPLQERRTPHP